MFALAVLLLIAAAALILWVLFGLNGEHNNQIHFDGFGFSTDLSPLTLFLLGALALALIWAATRLIAAATKRGMRKRKERKTLEKENKKTVAERDRLADERDRLAHERDDEHEHRETAEARQRVAERDYERVDADRAREHNLTKDGVVHDDAHTTRETVVTDEATDGRHYRR